MVTRQKAGTTIAVLCAVFCIALAAPGAHAECYDLERIEAAAGGAAQPGDPDYLKTLGNPEASLPDLSDALSAREWLTSQVGIARATLASQSERARLARLRYDNGATPFLEVLDAQRDLLAAQQQLVQTRAALLSSRVALYAALGGGALPPATGEQTPSSSAQPPTQDSSQ